MADSTIGLKWLLAAASALAGVFLIELALFFLSPSSELEARAAAAREAGRDFDARSRLEVVDFLRSRGIDAWPTMKPYLMLSQDHARLFPLGGISDSTSVYCNEGGVYSVFHTDEHGFRNPPGSHNREWVEAVIVGDSFGNGACVGAGRDPAAVLSSRGLSTLTLASPGNGPLIELATLVEYAEPLRPHTVLWFYFEGNDLKNLTDESRSEVLRRYLEEEHRQNLTQRQDEIDSTLRAVSDEWEAVTRAARKRQLLTRIRALVTLYHVRHLFGLTADSPDYDQAADLFCRVIERANVMVRTWNGRLIFVYLPSWYRYAPGRGAASIRFEPAVESCVERLGIHSIDFARVLDASDDPLAFFSFGVNPHYNEAGYRLLADAILAEVSQE